MAEGLYFLDCLALDLRIGESLRYYSARLQQRRG